MWQNYGLVSLLNVLRVFGYSTFFFFFLKFYNALKTSIKIWKWILFLVYNLNSFFLMVDWIFFLP